MDNLDIIPRQSFAEKAFHYFFIAVIALHLVAIIGAGVAS